METAPEHVHHPLLQQTPQLGWNQGREYAQWRAEMQSALTACLGDQPLPVDPQVHQTDWVDQGTFQECRIVFQSEAHSWVPMHVLLPHTPPPHRTVMILQGHTTGMHVGLGRPVYPGDEAYLANIPRPLALRAIDEGFAAVTLEQRCFGERRDLRPLHPWQQQRDSCAHASMVSLLLGRTMLGERVWDVSRALDILESMDELGPIGCIGGSGGGTVSYMAGCMDPRVQVVLASAAFCSWRWSIGAVDHCPDNYLPGAYRLFDMQDLACLIAPRPLVAITGATDPLFPLEGVQAGWHTVKEIYHKVDAPDACTLHIGMAGHQFYQDLAWPALHRAFGSLAS